MKREKYREAQFTTEVMRFLTPRVHEESGQVWVPPAWVAQAYRLPDLPRSGGLRFQKERPWDLQFQARVQTPAGITVAEFHAVELKLAKDCERVSKGVLKQHQFDALATADAAGINSFGWLVVQFRFWAPLSHAVSVRIGDRDRVALAVRATAWAGSDGPGRVDLPWCLRQGVEIHPIIVRPWASGEAKLGWDLSPLLGGGVRQQRKGA